MGSMERIERTEMLGIALVNGTSTENRKTTLFNFLGEEGHYNNLERLERIITESKQGNDIF